MRGTVLVVDTRQTGLVDTSTLREQGLIVHERNDSKQAMDLAAEVGPDVVVTVFSSPDGAPSISELRARVDHAVSILIVGVAESQRESARHSGADAFVGPASDLSYEIHRALILRRSGRRLIGF